MQKQVQKRLVYKSSNEMQNPWQPFHYSKIQEVMAIAQVQWYSTPHKYSGRKRILFSIWQFLPEKKVLQLTYDI